MLVGVWFSLLLWLPTTSQTEHPFGTVSIGALVPPVDRTPSLAEAALQHAVARINGDGSSHRTRLQLQLERLGDYEDTFVASKRVCRLFGLGVVAILGPQSEAMASHVLSMCDHKSIPVLETRWSYGAGRNSVSINLHPHPATLAKAVGEIVRATGWRRLTVVYEDNQSLTSIQEVLKLSLRQQYMQIDVQQLPANGEYRHLLRSLRDAGAKNFVVDCSADKALRFLKHAQMVGMIIKKYSYFITSLDLQTLPLEDYRYGGSNITGIRLLDPLSDTMLEAAIHWRRSELEQGARRLNISARQLTTRAALMYDAVTLLSLAIDDLQRPPLNDTAPLSLDTAPLSCSLESTWLHGESLVNYMKMVKFDGLTGPVEFDNDGLRKSFTLDIVQLQEQDLVKIGSWSSAGLHVDPVSVPLERLPRTNHTIIVTTVMKKPYTMLRSSSRLRQGNDRFEGICVDLMDRLAAKHHFNYTLVVNKDGRAGKRDPVTNRWNGMIGDLLQGRAHFAIADLTITGTRGKVINFTTQWMSLGISMVYTKPMQHPPSLFSFLSPFSLEVWAYMGLAMVGVSLLMFVLARFSPFEWAPPHPCHADRSELTNQLGLHNSLWLVCGSVMQQGSDILPKFSPYEWENPHPCNDEPEQLEIVLNINNSFWCAIGSLMQQGSDIAPKAMSTRMIAGSWWAFTLIMISSYTANLAAFLTIETRYSAIECADDLLKPRNSHIKYGMYAQGSTADFFRNSKVSPYTEMWKVMNTTPDVFRTSDEEGVRSVTEADGKYVYLMESSSIQYYVARSCNLAQVGGLLDNKGYGIGVSADSPIPASELSETIIQLQEEGVLAKLKNRWWKGDPGSLSCDVKKKGGKSLSLKNVGGVFVCLVFGLSVATVIAVVDFTRAVLRSSKEEGVPFATEASRELSFVFQFRGNTKPVKRPLTSDTGDDVLPFSTDSSLQYAPAGLTLRHTLT